MEEYHITKVENGQIVSVPFSKLEKEIAKKTLASLYHDLCLLKDKIAEIEQEHFGGNVVSIGLPLSEAVRNEISKKGSFKPRDITRALKKEYLGAYEMNTLRSTTYRIIKEMEDADSLLKRPDKSYFNKNYQEPEEIEEGDNDDLSSASMPLEEY